MLAGRREDWPGAMVELLAGAPWQKGKPPQREGRGKKTVARRPWQEGRGKKAGASKKKPAVASKRKLAGASKKKSQPAVAAT